MFFPQQPIHKAASAHSYYILRLLGLMFSTIIVINSVNNNSSGTVNKVLTNCLLQFDRDSPTGRESSAY